MKRNPTLRRIHVIGGIGSERNYAADQLSQQMGIPSYDLEEAPDQGLVLHSYNPYHAPLIGQLCRRYPRRACSRRAVRAGPFRPLSPLTDSTSNDDSVVISLCAGVSTLVR